MGANYRGYNPVTEDDIWTIAGEQKVADGGEIKVESGGKLTIESGGIVEGGPLAVQEITFVEDGAGTYTGSVTLPAGATLINVIVHAVALWTAGTSAALIVGDVADPNGFFDAVNLKATDLLAGESIDFAHTGGVEGADVDAPAAAVAVRRRYLAGARVVTGEVTSVGAGTAGRTRITVLYSMPATSVLATKA